MPALLPLTHWFCDKCGQTADLKSGWLEWITPDSTPSGFRIVHQHTELPRR